MQPQLLLDAVLPKYGVGGQVHRLLFILFSMPHVLWMLSGLTHRHIHVCNRYMAVSDKCLAYIMKFPMTVLLFLSYVKLNKSNVTLHSGIIIFSLCPNIYGNITSV